MKTTIVPAIVIVITGSLLGVVVNAVRSKDSINLGRNYFRVATADSLNDRFTSVNIDEVIELYQGSGYELGDVVFVDARKDEAYEEAHIPGALQIDNYNLDRDYPAVKDDLEAASIVVVYCGGGECEDSIYLATELEGLGLSRSKIRLFEGGLEQWREEQLEVEEGRF